MKLRNNFFQILKHPFLFGSFMLVAAGLGTNAINYLYHLLMGRIMGPERYGDLASLYSILYIVGIIPLSSSVAIVKFISSAKTKGELGGVYNGINKLLTRIAIISAIAVVVLSPFVSNFLHISDILSVVLVGPTVFFTLTALVNQASLQGIMKFAGSAVPSFAMSFTKTLVGISLVLLGLSVTGAMVGVWMGAVAAYFVSLKYKVNHFHSKKVVDFDLGKFLKYSRPVLLQSIAFTFIFTVDVMLVKHFFPPFEAGIYSALSTLGKMIFFAASPVATAMFPFVSSRKSKGEKYFRILLGSLVITSLLSLSVLTVFLVFPDLAIGVLYGKAYLAAKNELIWMGLFISFYTAGNLLVNFFLAIDKVRIVLIPIIAAILQIILIWNFHPSLLVVIQISLILMVVQFLILALYLGYVKFLLYEEK